MTTNLSDTEVQAVAEPTFPLQGTVAAVENQRGYIARSLHQLRAGAWPTLKYLAETEVHTYAFSVAANAILSFVPAVVLMGTISRYILHSRPMYNLLFRLLQSYLPTWNYADKMKVVTSLQGLVRSHHTIEVMSVVMLLISSTGVFEPLEVALNKVWGFKANRNYLMNQVVSLGLALGCGVLALGSVALTTQTQSMAAPLLPGHVAKPIERGSARSTTAAGKPIQVQQQSVEDTAFIGKAKQSLEQIFTGVQNLTSLLIMKAFALITSIVIFFLIYWLLPNGKVHAMDVLPAAIATGISLEIAKYIFMLVMTFLNFREDYGIMFYIPVTLIFWAFTAGLLMLGGAHLSAYGKTQE